jgi:hypothetical protein
LAQAGVISRLEMTAEPALTKPAFLLSGDLLTDNTKR